MYSVTDDALLVLRVMMEYGFDSDQYATKSQLKELSGLEGNAYDRAEHYLLEKHLIDPYGLGDNGARRVSSIGIDYVTQAMQSRIPISLNAERILRFVHDVEPPRKPFEEIFGVQPPQIEVQLNLQPEEVLNGFRELEVEGLIESTYPAVSTTAWGAFTTHEGRRAVKHNFRVPQSVNSSIGIINQGTINANNLVSAPNSQVQQTFNQNDPAAIRQAIDETLAKIVGEVIGQLEFNQQIAYLQVVASLKEELAKPQPSRSTVERFIDIIKFGDAFNGALELGDKVNQIAPLVLPLIPALVERVAHLFQVLSS